MPDSSLVPDRVLRVYPDNEPTPLLGVDNLRPLTGADVGLSAQLTARIDAWHALFQAEHLERHEWRSADAAATYARDGRAIVDALVTELPGFLIEYSLWPVGDGGGYAGGWATGWSPSGERPLPAGTVVRSFDVARERWIRLMSDYSSTALWATSGNVGPDSLDLPAGLAAELQAWQDLWERELDWETGWSSDAAAQRYRDEGLRLLPLVAAELPGHVVELIAGGDRVYAGAWVDGWLPTLPEGYYTAYRN